MQLSESDLTSPDMSRRKDERLLVLTAKQERRGLRTVGKLCASVAIGADELVEVSARSVLHDDVQILLV